MAEIKIIHEPSESEPYVVIYKPSGIPSAPLKEGDESALTQVLLKYPQLKAVKGKKEVEYGLLHRIDTVTSGLLLIASTQESYDNLTQQQKNGDFTKSYKATVEYSGPTENKSFSVTSTFRPFGPKGAQVKPVFENSTTADKKKSGTKQYTTKIEINGHTAICTIKEGYRHQVRAHLSYSGYPIAGDKLYNPTTKTEEMFFEACRFDFINPFNGEKVWYSV